MYIGVHVPFGKQGRRRHRHRGHRHHRRKREKETDREDGRESPSYGKKSAVRVVSLENKLVVVTLCLNVVCFVLVFFILTLLNVFLCIIRQQFCGHVLSKS